MKKIIGYSMLFIVFTVVFGGMFLAIAVEDGIWVALAVFGLTFILAAMIIVGNNLIVE